MNRDCAPQPVRSKPRDSHDIGITSASDIEVKQPNTAAKHKKPYEKPAFRFEKVFVTTALSCGKLAGTCGSMSTKAS
ncbi:MAG: hypothetical protein ABSG72_06985 [Candidatus Sulfotelmatobacter sp.]|jgi:hypothetical protein